MFFDFFPLLNVAALQWHAAEAAITISHGPFIYGSDVSLCFSMFLYSLFSVSNHTLTLRSKAAMLADASLPLLVAQTGYYVCALFSQIRKHFNPSNTDYFDCDLFRPPPHSPQTVLYANVRFVFILLFSSWSDETWMLESFPVMKVLSHPPFSLSMLAFCFLLFCCVNQAWKLHFCLVFNLV